jgi:hypothetical protein
MSIDIHVMAWDRHTNVAGLNIFNGILNLLIMDFQWQYRYSQLQKLSIVWFSIDFHVTR